MCGICGYVGKEKIADEILIRMRDTMYHRGPDDGGIWQEASDGVAVGLAQRRLSILDLSAMGHQPMFSEDGNAVIVFNGEIYNFRELRAELQNKGAVFRTACDTEVILAAYEVWGTACFNRLNGMFAIGLWDKRDRSLILARDRIGKKPLYYYWNRLKGELVFASELKPVMQYPRFPKTIRRDMIGNFLCNKYIAAPDTIFEDTYKMAPGTYLLYRDNQVQIRSYWDINAVREEKRQQMIRTQQASLQELDALLLDAVSRRLIADVPVGTFLSGGIDSTLVTAMAQKCKDTPVQSFSIGFYDKERNEAPYAAEIARYIGTKHRELYVGEKEILEMLQQLPFYYDEPFSDSSQLPTMLVSRLAAADVTVALSGDGGDELFCGYKMYDWTYVAQKADWIGAALYYTPGMRMVKEKLPPELRAFINNRSGDYKTQLFIDVMVEEAEKLLGIPACAAKFVHEKKLKDCNWQERRMMLDMMTYLPDEILAKTDRASMKYSLEVRCPLLDYRVIEKSFQIPHNCKYNRWDKKHILKELTYRYVPETLLDRPKKGFGVPLRKWLRGVLKENIRKYADREILKRQGIFVPRAVEALIARQAVSDKIMYSSMLWSFYVFQTWYQMYIEDFWSR